MKRFIKRQWKKLVAFLALFTIVPLTINILFKIHGTLKIFQAEWTAGDFLTFYGSLVAAALTVYGVFLTIQYSQSNYREDVHNRVLPYLSLNTLRSKSNYNLFSDDSFEKSEQDNNYESNCYKEYRLSEIYIIIENNNITYKTGLTQAQQKLLTQGGRKWVPESPGKFSFQGVDLVSIPIEIENVGNGSAISLRIGLNHYNSANPQYVNPLNLKPNNQIYLHIYAENPNEEALDSYKLSLYYDDIFGKSYKQEYKFDIIKEDMKIISRLDFSGKQETYIK